MSNLRDWLANSEEVVIESIEFFFFFFLVTYIICFVPGFLSLNWILISAGAILLVCSLTFFITGVFRVQEQERAIMERFGAFHRIASPGLNWRFPFSWVDSVRRYVGIWEKGIELFPGETSIDFEGGGTASLDKIKGYFQISREEPDGDIPEHIERKIDNTTMQERERNIRKNCYLSEYEIKDWEEAIQDSLEKVTRNILNIRRVEEVLKFVNWKELIEATSDFVEDIKNWGIHFKRLTLKDYAWSEAVKQARVEIFEAERKIEVEQLKQEAAEQVSKRWAREIAQTYAEIKRIIVQMGGNKEEAQQLAKRGVMRKIASEADQFKMHDIRPVLEDLEMQDVLNFIETFTD